MITFKQKGDFSKLNKYLDEAKVAIQKGDFNRFGEAGVRALRETTPKDTGLTALSWYYSIQKTNDKIYIRFHNSNIVDGVKIAIVLQYGHATANGGWVEGRDYINPALRPVFDDILYEACKEVRRL